MFRWLLKSKQAPALNGEILPPIPPGDGWREWMRDAPPRSAGQLEGWRREWGEVRVLNTRDIAPMMNVWGLFWRFRDSTVTPRPCAPIASDGG